MGCVESKEHLKIEMAKMLLSPVHTSVEFGGVSCPQRDGKRGCSDGTKGNEECGNVATNMGE